MENLIGIKMSLELAIKYAKKNPIRPRGRNTISRFAAVLSGPGGIFVGYNSYKSHPLQARFAKRTGNPEKLSIHAEVSAIVKAVQRGRVRDFSGYRIYVARLLSDGTPALARPCESCLAALSEFGITNVEYTE